MTPRYLYVVSVRHHDTESAEAGPFLLKRDAKNAMAKAARNVVPDAHLVRNTLYSATIFSGNTSVGYVYVERIDGDYFAVMGLALGRMVALMADLGVEYRFNMPLTAVAK